MMNGTFDSIASPARTRRAPRAKESALSPDTRMMLKGGNLTYEKTANYLTYRFTLEFMKASKLNNNQTKFLDEVIRDGTALPKCPSQLQARPRIHALSSQKSSGKSCQVSYASRPRIRTLEKIRETGGYDLEPFCPRPTSDLFSLRDLLEYYTHTV